MARRKRKSTPEPEDVSDAAEFSEGQEAYRAGITICPYPQAEGSNWCRFRWWRGYLHERFPVD
jgi:hypothetical protein